MNKQRGYLEGIGQAILMFCVLCIVFGIFLGKFLSWVWPFIKAWVHAATA